MRLCEVDGCERPHEAKGLCQMHYQRLKKGIDMQAPKHTPKSISEKFWPKIQKTKTCWLWTGAKLPLGYGIINGGRKSSKNLYAHRVSYELHNGAIPAGLVVMHTCDNPCCCNPDHLKVGTHKDNSQDMVQKGRSRPSTGESNPRSKLSEDDVRAIRSSIEPSDVLSVSYKVSKSCISAARRGTNWSHIK